MEMHGYIQDMLDVKVLILFVVKRSEYPLTLQQIYELSFQDDRLSYFDVSIAIPELVESGHLETVGEDCYQITDKGREHEQITEDGLAFSVRQRAAAAVEQFNRQVKRDKRLQTQVVEKPTGEYAAILGLDDGVGELMKLELTAPTRQQARVLEKAFHTRADSVYKLVLQVLLDREEGWEE